MWAPMEQTGKWWCAENVSGVTVQRTIHSLHVQIWIQRESLHQVWIKKTSNLSACDFIHIFLALTLTSVVVMLGWVTRQGMTSGCFSFMYNTSGLIPGCSTNGCWLSETQTLRSGTHIVQIISMSNKCMNKTLFCLTHQYHINKSLQPPIQIHKKYRKTYFLTYLSWNLTLHWWWFYFIFVVYYTFRLQLTIIFIIKKSFSIITFCFVVPKHSQESLWQRLWVQADILKCPILDNQWFKLGMHNDIGLSSVSDDISFKMEYWNQPTCW